jgi:toxin-antitoxin system PIN domain toxin
VIAVDTNVLVYAHRQDSPWHDKARESIARLAEGRSSWSIPWPCIHEFLAIVTHPRIYDPPTPTSRALDQVAAWMEAPGLVLLAEGPGYWEFLQRLVATGRIAGPKVHDARVAAICLHHGVNEFWSADRDFGSFPELTVRNPLVA